MRGLGFPHTRGRVVLLVLVVPLVFRASPVVSGRAARCARGRRPARSPALLCPARSPAAAWPARPLAVRAASFVRRVVSKPGQAPQAPRRPPIGRCLSLVCCRLVSATAHGHRRQVRWFSRRPPHRRHLAADGFSTRLLEARPVPPPTGTADKFAGSPGALHISGAGSLMCGWRVALMSSYGCRSATSHVIPRRLIETLNLHRWNCNVFGVSRKMTAINYVRDLAGGGVVAAHGHRSQARWFSRRPTPAAMGVWQH